jgi:integrase
MERSNDKSRARTPRKTPGVGQRPGKTGWWVRLTINGRERRFRCDTKSQAVALHGRLKADIREEKYFPEKFATKKVLTLGAWLDQCVEQSTNRNLVNERCYAQLWKGYFGNRLLTDISTSDIQRQRAAMRATLKPRPAYVPATVPQKRKWSDATINRHVAFLKHVFAMAVRDGLLTRNPVTGLKLFPEIASTRYLSDEEISRLHGVMAAGDWQIVALAIETGLRREEQFRLRWEQVDLESGLLVLPMPKGGKTRYVPLSEIAQGILRSFGSFLSSPWVFPSELDPTKPMDGRGFVRRVYGPALRRAGIVKANFHALRHTAASRRVSAGVSLTAVKEILGHRSINTTLRYSHLSPAHLREAVNTGSLKIIGTPSGTSAAIREDTAIKEAQPIDFLARPAELGQIVTSQSN